LLKYLYIKIRKNGPIEGKQIPLFTAKIIRRVSLYPYKLTQYLVNYDQSKENSCFFRADAFYLFVDPVSYLIYWLLKIVGIYSYLFNIFEITVSS